MPFLLPGLAKVIQKYQEKSWIQSMGTTICVKHTDDQLHLYLKITVRTAAAAHGVSVCTIHSIIHTDLGLEKKSA
jgi:hypothetical protein